MNKAKFISLLSLTSAFCLLSCGGEPSSSRPEGSPTATSASEPEPEPEPTVSVFVLSGQSNMEGQTQWGNNYLANAMQQLADDGYDVYPEDYDILAGEDGIPEVRTSYYGCGYGEIGNPRNIHASNKETPIDGQFENTRVGMGAKDDRMGPELGAAYILRDYATEEKPIYFIKCGVSGSGFAQSGSNAINWNVEEDPNLYDAHLRPYTQNCLDLIEEETGVHPTICGFLWMQGESDSDSKKIPYYNDRVNMLLDTFKSDFVDYAKDGDVDNIAFIDACIYDKDGTPWGAQTSQDINAAKMENAEAHDNYYCINTSWKIEGGMQLKTGSPGGDNMHYCTESSFRLGMAYADVIIENDLLA